ncbi:gamma-interferon-responsive lysosomal thiol protein-like, partial [Lycium ferocissimum]|uniref:gamma-interferon-responsive lysosomal thiol protein-like n=1 Tax=Lycium ferocissimum TaxID=112874 RepID=UPI002815C822
LALYYESLCPYCSNFIVNYLPKIFIDIVDFKLFPWGNTKLKANNTFKCQHGPGECFLDTVEACAIDAFPDLNDHFPFIYSVEILVYHKNYSQWETCFEKTEFEGKELQLSTSTILKHKYVPSVVVDGQPLYDDYKDFISFICKAYKRNCSSPRL